MIEHINFRILLHVHKLFTTILLLIVNSNCYASHPSPFLTRNESPFSIIFGLPLASSAQLLDKNQSRWISSFNISNTLNAQAKNTGNNNESLLIDIETWHINFLYDYNFKENWMLRLQLPYIVHSGGFLDSTIDTYHQTLGLPENIRPDFSHDQIDINVTLNNESLVNINNKQSSLGDISIQLALQAEKSEQSALSYWLSLKLPSGDTDKLTGSGGTDLAMWTSMDYLLTGSRWLYGQAGLLYMSDSDILKNIQKNWAAFANGGIKLEPWSNLELKAQLDFHSAFYDSELEFLSHVLQLTFGVSYAISKKHKLDFAVAEDIKNSASPDVNFNISWWINY